MHEHECRVCGRSMKQEGRPAPEHVCHCDCRACISALPGKEGTWAEWEDVSPEDQRAFLEANGATLMAAKKIEDN